MRRIATVVSLLFALTLLMVALAPLALAEPVGCTTTYVGALTNPPADADILICEGKLCTDGVGVSPSGAGNYAGHAGGATETYVACVV